MRDIIRVSALLFGLLAAMFSLLAALLLALAMALGDHAPRLMNLTLLVSLLALGVGLGLPLAAAARRSLQQRASPALRLPGKPIGAQAALLHDAQRNPTWRPYLWTT